MEFGVAFRRRLLGINDPTENEPDAESTVGITLVTLRIPHADILVGFWL
jgi:hypothetical protein